MRNETDSRRSSGMVTLLLALVSAPIACAADEASDAVADALSAAWPGMAEGATVVDWEGNLLKEGTNGFTVTTDADRRLTHVHGQRVDEVGRRLAEQKRLCP